MRDDLLSISIDAHAEFRKFLNGVEFDRDRLVKDFQRLLETIGGASPPRYCRKCGEKITKR